MVLNEINGIEQVNYAVIKSKHDLVCETVRCMRLE